MKKLIFLFFCPLIFFFSLTGFTKNLCKTKEICEAGSLCECTLTPSSGFDRHFYFIMTDIEPNTSYECNFTAFPSTFTLVLDSSTFPLGTNIYCDTDCPRFPATLGVLIQNISSESDKSMSIKYFVPGSSFVNDVTAACKKII